MNSKRGGASTSEIELVYRERFARFLHVATAITGNVEVAADAVQDAFVRAIRLRASYRGKGSVEAWLWRIVVNTARAHASRAQEFSALDETVEPGPELVAGESAALRVVLASLPERQRLVLFLRYYADMDYDTIADALEISVRNRGGVLHRAFSAEMQRFGHMSTALPARGARRRARHGGRDSQRLSADRPRPEIVRFPAANGPCRPAFKL
jgi:RNA polymerase sigma factor (sigma-70 family)